MSLREATHAPRGALEIAMRALMHTRRRVTESLHYRTGLKHPTYCARDGRRKEVLTIDQEAEDACTNFLLKHFGDRELRVLGEESLWMFPDLDLSKEHLEGYGEDARVVPGAESRMVAIIDMVNGSDLLERKFGNWCSAVVFFKPNQPVGVVFALVHHSDGAIYGAHAKGTFLYRPVRGRLKYLGPLGGTEPRKLTRSNPDRTLPEEQGGLPMFQSPETRSFDYVCPRAFKDGQAILRRRIGCGSLILPVIL